MAKKNGLDIVEYIEETAQRIPALRENKAFAKFLKENKATIVAIREKHADPATLEELLRQVPWEVAKEIGRFAKPMEGQKQVSERAIHRFIWQFPYVSAALVKNEIDRRLAGVEDLVKIKNKMLDEEG